MSAVAWLLAGIFVVNLLIAAWLITLGLVDRYQRHRVIQEVDALERSLAMPSAAPIARRIGGMHRGVVVRERARVAGAAHRAVAVRRSPGMPRRVGRASISLALAGMALWASVAIPDLGDRPAVRSSDDGGGLEFPVTWGRRSESGSTGRVDLPGSWEGGSAEAGDSLDPQTDTPPPPTNTNVSTTFDAETVIDRVAARVRSATQIQLAWEAVPEAIDYTIERWGDRADSSGWVVIATVHAETTFTDVGLEADTTYYYRVAAVTEEGAAPPSNVVSATTSIAPPGATILTALVTATRIDLAWVDVADETAYRIERSPHGASDWASIGTTGQDVTTYTDAAVVAEMKYRYRVVATNAGGDSTPSNVVSAKVTVEVTTPPDDSHPPQPDGEKPPKKETPPLSEEPVVSESPVTEDTAATGESSIIESS
jgi:hypothetical protein